MEYTYEITRFRTAPALGNKSDVILGIEFLYKASDVRDDVTYTSQTLGSITLDDPADDTNFIPYGDVTEAKVIEWIEAVLIIENMQDTLSADIDNQQVPRDVVRDDLPWVTEETEETEE